MNDAIVWLQSSALPDLGQAYSISAPSDNLREGVFGRLHPGASTRYYRDLHACASCAVPPTTIPPCLQDNSGVSRDEMAAALSAVAEGRVPTDRIALRELYREMINWPFLDKDAPTGDTGSEGPAGSSSGSTVTPAAEEAAAAWRKQPAVQPRMGRDPSEKPQSLADSLPDWVGYGALYAVSVLPLVIAGTVILVLFLNSLK